MRSIRSRGVLFLRPGEFRNFVSLWVVGARLWQQQSAGFLDMCHETTSVALKKTIGVGVGTVVFEDLSKSDAMFFFGQNPGLNSPRSSCIRYRKRRSEASRL